MAIRWGGVAIAALLAASVARAEDDAASAPTTYELMINGESFIVEANRAVTLQSKAKPGTAYEVALRVSPVQYLRLNNIRLEYDLRTKVDDNRQAERRSARLTHELGFSMLVTDLGDPLDAGARETALQMLTESVLKSHRRQGANDAQGEVTRLKDAQFRSAEGRGVQIRHKDADGIEHVSLVYVLVGKTFTSSCIVQYLEADSENVLPLVKRTLDSIEATGAKKPTLAPAPERPKP